VIRGFGNNNSGTLGNGAMCGAAMKIFSPKKNLGKTGRQCIKLRKNKVNLVLSEDIKMNQIVELENQDLTRHFFDRKISKNNLRKWIDMEWRTLIGYSPKFHLIRRGWLAFIFKAEEDATKISNSRCLWCSTPLTLKR
jgi:hypothetical protein